MGKRVIETRREAGARLTFLRTKLFSSDVDVVFLDSSSTKISSFRIQYFQIENSHFRNRLSRGTDDLTETKSGRLRYLVFPRRADWRIAPTDLRSGSRSS